MSFIPAQTNTAHIPQLPQCTPVSAFPQRRPRQSLPHRIHAPTLCIPSSELLSQHPQASIVPAAPLRQRRSHTEHSHVHLRAAPASAPSRRIYIRALLWCQTPLCGLPFLTPGLAAPPGVPAQLRRCQRTPPDREVVDGHLLYSKWEQGWQKPPST